MPRDRAWSGPNTLDNQKLLPLLLPEEASEILEIPLSHISEAMKLGDAGFTFGTVVSPDYAYERATEITAGKAV